MSIYWNMNHAGRVHIATMFVPMVAVCLWCAVGWAAPVQPDDMFFPPASMVEGVYPIQPTNGDGVSSPWVATWTASDILSIDPGRVDITFTAVEVLPVLVPNPSPSSAEGEYADSDLAAINVTNYASFYLQRPGTDIMDPATDYTADLEPNEVTFTATAPAIYAIRIITQSRPAPAAPLEEVEYVYNEFLADFFGEDGARDRAAVTRKGSLPATDLYVISDMDPNDNGFLTNSASNLADEGKNTCAAKDLAAAVKCVCDESKRLGRKISVTLIGHGRPGSIKIGTERINNDTDSVNTPPVFQKKIDKCVDKLHLFSCNTADGNAGSQFMKEFAKSITKGAGGWKNTVTAAAKSTFLLIKVRSGYFDIQAKAKEEKKGLDFNGAGRPHFQCYEVEGHPRLTSGISLNDQFGPGMVDARKLKRLCNPADMNGDDPTAPSNPEHLSGYIVRQTSPPFVPVRDLVVANELGTFAVQLVKPTLMLVPSAIGVGTQATPLVNPQIDHFKCYKIKSTRARVFGVPVQDQFGTFSEDVKRPTRLCVPADENGSGIQNPNENLMCFKIVPQPPFRGPTATIFIDDELTTNQGFRVNHPRELCLPTDFL
jgi:hypothetical protein